MTRKLLVSLFLASAVLVSVERIEPELILDIPIPEVSLEILEPPTVVVTIPLIRISAYNPVPGQTWGDPNVSSCGPNLEKQIAVSRDLFFDEHGKKHLCGVRVTVITDRGEEFQDYVIWDTMNPRYTNTADILIPEVDESKAFAFGVTTGQLLIHGN